MKCTKCGSEINEEASNFTTDFATFIYCEECSKKIKEERGIK
jgi:DNA-directed RNA polymerase subunit RPC12/RpoP